MVTVLEAATSARITKQKVRYWLDLLEVETTRKEGKIYLPATAIDLLIAMRKAVNSGIAPSVAAAEIKNTFIAPAIAPAQPENHTAIVERLHDLEKSVILLAESNRKLSEDNKSLAALVLAQNRKLDFLSEKLLPPPNIEPVKTWEPTKKAEVKVPLLKRIWLELWAPEKLRAIP